MAGEVRPLVMNRSNWMAVSLVNKIYASANPGIPSPGTVYLKLEFRVGRVASCDARGMITLCDFAEMGRLPSPRPYGQAIES